MNAKCLLALLLVTPSALAAEPCFESLFDGRDLSGWQGVTAPAEQSWQVADGRIECTGQTGTWLRSEKQYDDFNLRLEYKLLRGGNSGIYLRVAADGAHRDDGTGLEVQILDDAAERYRTIAPGQFCGSLYKIAPATQHVSRPAGEWNSLEIDCRGTAYRVTHNGVVVVDANAEQFPELGRRRQKGYIGLQNHREQVWFRNLRIGPSVDAAAAAGG